MRKKEEEVRERDLKIQELEAMGAAHEAAVQAGFAGHARATCMGMCLLQLGKKPSF